MKNSTEQITRKINHEKWKNIAGFLIPWMRDMSNTYTIEQYYKEFKKQYKKQYKKIPPFFLEEVLGMMMFMTTEQIVVFQEKDWNYLEIYYDKVQYKDGRKGLEPVGFKIVPKIITE